MDAAAQSTDPTGYTVVARRYRPKSFGELIGQDHIAQALSKAIDTGRVGHAYLFTGARGVGKTSTARIFAKALNIPPSTPPEVAQEIAAAVDAGEDIDVIEIDGASNRGIEEIRQLRSNVNIRPSRCPYRIYIIDEVHMLTSAAFNALLKTLEEPPPHVKFIFCTTDPDKLPITVLSRCQRFDFAPVKTDAIQQRLQEICVQEGFQADEAALALLARRANGSMRDSQSLLEQVMSFADGHITIDSVNAILGTANEGRLVELIGALVGGDAARSIQIVAQSQQEGADAGQLAEQLLGYLRDMMALAVGGSEELLRMAGASVVPTLEEHAQSWGLQTILAAIQILDEALVRMRTSVSAVTLLEVALVEICNLEQFASLADLVERVTATSAGLPQKKTPDLTRSDAPPRPEPARSDPQPAGSTSPPAPQPPTATGIPARPSSAPAQGHADPAPAAESNPPPPPADAPPRDVVHNHQQEKPVGTGPSAPAMDIWQRAARRLDGMLSDLALLAVAVEPLGRDKWRIVFPSGGNHACQMCEQPERKQQLLQALRAEAGRNIQLTMTVQPGTPPVPPAQDSPSAIRARRERELHEHPYVKKLCEVLQGEILRVDLAATPATGPNGKPITTNAE